jgi:hypothetical protein
MGAWQWKSGVGGGPPLSGTAPRPAGDWQQWPRHERHEPCITGTLHTLNKRMNDLRQSMNTGFVVLGALSAANLAAMIALAVVWMRR